MKFQSCGYLKKYALIFLLTCISGPSIAGYIPEMVCTDNNKPWLPNIESGEFPSIESAREAGERYAGRMRSSSGLDCKVNRIFNALTKDYVNLNQQVTKDAEIKRQANSSPAPQNSSMNTMEFGQLAIKSLGNKSSYRNAVASTISYNDYGICIPLELSIVASELKGVIFKKDTSQTFGLLWADLDFFRKNELAKGVPESVLEDSWKPYQQEALINQQAYFNKYGNYCANVAGKVSQKAAGK